MELLKIFVDFILHLDKNLGSIIQVYGLWTYLILFLIIFLETGFVVTPMLPGDSLLFAAGALASIGSLNIGVLFLILALAAILGDTLNYWIGYYIGPKVFKEERVRFFKKEYLERTRIFYEKYGGKTIILARFVPIIRTFAPLVAGIGKMNYFRFVAYNIIGGIGWVAFFVFGGYYFGNIPIVKRNFGIVILAIIFVSLIPIAVEFFRHRKERGS